MELLAEKSVFAVDKGGICDRIEQFQGDDETSGGAARKREGDGESPSVSVPAQATSEPPATSGTIHPRYRMQ